MSFKSSNQKNNSNGGSSPLSISSILKMVSAAFNMNNTPAQSLPPPVVITGGGIRSGLSARDISARIIARRPEAGLPSGDIFPDTPNCDEVMEMIRIEEIIDAILTESVVQIAIEPGMQVLGSGVGNLGAPILVQGSTTTIGTGKGIIL